MVRDSVVSWETPDSRFSKRFSDSCSLVVAVLRPLKNGRIMEFLAELRLEMFFETGVSL